MQTIRTPLPQLLERHATYETHPPLYFLQLRAWAHIFGGSLAALRANSALVGTLTLIAFYALVRRYALGLFALAFMAFAPLPLAYSQEMRPYALAVFLAVCAAWSTERTVGAGHRARPQSESGGSSDVVGRHSGLPLQVFFWTALLYTHYWGAFVCAAQGVYALAAARTPDARRRVIWAGVISVALFACWLPILHRQLHAIGALSFWVDPPSVINLGKTVVAYTGVMFKVASSAFRMPGPLPILILIGACHLLLLGWGITAAPRLAVAWLALGLALPWALSYAMHGLYVWYRYPVLMWPAYALIVASGLRRLRWPALRGLLMGVLIGAEAVGLWRYFSGWQKANPKAVVAFVDAYAPLHPLVIRPAYFSFLYKYYDQGRTQPLDTDAFDSLAKRAALRGHVIFLLGFDDAPDPIRDAFLAEFHRIGQRRFPGFGHLGITVYVLK